MGERIRPDSPRLTPLDVDELDDETRERLGARPLNIFRTLARHPKLLKRWTVFAFHVLGKGSLPARERELLILRTGWNCRAQYEFGHHAVIARESGMTNEEVEATTRPLDTHPWTDTDQTLLRAADELYADQCITDPTWSALAVTWNEQQLLDLIFAVGEYTLVSMVANSIGVSLEGGIDGFPSYYVTDTISGDPNC
jgi:alkylhydroperoxidase family enzyme